MLTSGFFNSRNGDRKFNAEDLSNYFGSLISNGVLPNPSTNLQVVAAGGLSVHVKPGKGYIDCHYVKNTDLYKISIATADYLLPRIDAIVLRLDLTDEARSIEICYMKGTAGSLPEPPEMVRKTLIKEYCLAHILVEPGAMEITQSSIIDTRADNNVCGWVTALIDKVDTSTLFMQWQEAGVEFFTDAEEQFRVWLDGIQDVLSNTENGKLLQELYELYHALYTRATEKDIDKIIDGSYIEDDGDGYFETASKEDIDNIISGIYVDIEEEDITQEKITEIVDNLFR